MWQSIFFVIISSGGPHLPFQCWNIYKRTNKRKKTFRHERDRSSVNKRCRQRLHSHFTAHFLKEHPQSKIDRQRQGAQAQVQEHRRAPSPHQILTTLPFSCFLFLYVAEAKFNAWCVFFLFFVKQVRFNSIEYAALLAILSCPSAFPAPTLLLPSTLFSLSSVLLLSWRMGIVDSPSLCHLPSYPLFIYSCRRSNTAFANTLPFSTRRYPFIWNWCYPSPSLELYPFTIVSTCICFFCFVFPTLFKACELLLYLSFLSSRLALLRVLHSSIYVYLRKFAIK